jgi:hypothetical protein
MPGENAQILIRYKYLSFQVLGPRFCYNISNLDQGQQFRVKVAAHIEGNTYGPFSQIGEW